MKKIICLLLCAVFCLSAFTSCERAEAGPVTVTVAVDIGSLTYLSKFKDRAEAMYDVEIEFVAIPDEFDTTRDFVLQQLRTEIMAGKGPDVFLLPTQPVSMHDEPLFLNVEEAMRSGLFLPLDEFIAEAELLNMENHFEVIMDAGKLGNEQLVLPLMYYYEVSPVQKYELLDPDLEIRYPRDIVDSGDYKRIAAANRSYLGSMFGDMVDYDTMNITISEEEIADNPQCVNLLMPNSDGGITATITAFAAVNRNTEHPDEAFKVMELFFSYDTFRDSGLRAQSLFFHSVDGIATGKDYYGEEDLIDTDFLERTAEKITDVRFYSDIDTLLFKTYADLHIAIYSGMEYNIDEMAAELHRQLKMMAAE